MNATLKALQQRFTTLSLNQQVMLGTIIVGMAFAGFFLFQKANDNYDVLYSKLSTADAAATVNKLKEAHVPYKLADGGTTVLVPAGEINNMRLETANELTSSEAISLSKIPPVLQGDVQKEWLKKFNTDQISVTLTSIEGITQAKVMVATPEESVFSENNEPIRASVMLIVEPGFRLKEKQIETIRNLVSHAVPGLKPDQVVLSDNYGNLLDDSPSSGTALQTRDTRKTKTEQEMQKKLQILIEPIVGEGNAVVSVSASLNFDQARAKIKNVKPTIENDNKAMGVVVSEQNSSEAYEGAKKAEGGPVGTETNAAPSYQSNTDDAKSDKTYRSEKNTRNYAHSEEQKEIVYASGVVDRMTVAVVLNKVLTDGETQELKEMIINAAGLNLERGDSVDVKGFTFSEAPNLKNKQMAEAFKASQQNDFFLQIGYILTLLVLGIMALGILRKMFDKPFAIAQAQLIIDDEGRPIPEIMYTEDGNEITQNMLETDGQGKLIAPPEPVYDAGGKLIKLGSVTRETLNLPSVAYDSAPELEYMRQSIYGFIQKDPVEAARILVTFMNQN